MKNKIITIYYAKNERGPAEVLDGRIARIVDVPVFTDKFWRDDIVKLTHLPKDSSTPPKIAKVLYTRQDCRSVVTFSDEFAANKLMDIFSLLGADSSVMLTVEGRKPNRLSVAHSRFLDPLVIARILGGGPVKEEKSEGAAPNPEEHQDP